MSLYRLLFKTSVGKKVIMAVTGVILILFIIGHLAGNLQIFLPPAQINAYAHGLAELAPIVWVVRFILLVAVILHIWMAVALTIENKRARPQNYEKWQSVQATYAARTMRMSGLIVFAFILFHLAHYTFLWVHPEYAALTFALEPGIEVLDVHGMMVAGFSNIWISLFYIAAIGLLSAHLAHGLSSLFQSIGWRNASWAPGLEKISYGFAVIYFLLNAVIPLSVLTGIISRPDLPQLL